MKRAIGLVLFAGFHGVALLGAHWAKISLFWVLACLASYALRTFLVSVVYHRYFAHRSYRMGRVAQAVLGALGCTAFQRGPLWWASHHRVHHLYSDREGDVHSPHTRSTLYAHLGWLLDGTHDETDLTKVGDFAKFRELLWIDRASALISALFLAVCWTFGGFTAVYWLGIVSTVMCWHAILSINSLAHLSGARRFETPDESRNNTFVAWIAMGEGWHNNHHAQMNQPRLGRARGEVDLGYLGLRALFALGIAAENRSASISRPES